MQDSKQVFQIDSNGFFVEPVIIHCKYDSNQQPLPFVIPSDCVEADPPKGFYKPKWNGTAWVEGETSPTALASAKTIKIDEIKRACNQTILGGFDCDPTGSGTVYHYPFSYNDQSNMAQQTIRILQNKVTQPFNWKVQDSSGNWIELSHTYADFNTVTDKADAFKWAQITQCRDLETQINDATTITDVQAVTWTPATY